MAKRDRAEADQRPGESVPMAETGEDSADAVNPMKIETHEELADAAAGRVAEAEINHMAARSKGIFKQRVSSPVSCAEMDEAIADAVMEEFDSSTDNYRG